MVLKLLKSFINKKCYKQVFPRQNRKIYKKILETTEQPKKQFISLTSQNRQTTNGWFFEFLYVVEMTF